MPQPRPSLALALHIPESLASQETCLEIKRCYTYVGSTVVRTLPSRAPLSEHATDISSDLDKPFIQFMVKFGTRTYLNYPDHDQADLWTDIIERWLYNQLHTVGNQMLIYNRRQRDIQGTELIFNYLDVVLEEGALTIRLKLDSNSWIDPTATTTITAIRNHYAQGNLGSNPICVCAPAPFSYDQQLAQYKLNRSQDALSTQAQTCHDEDVQKEQVSIFVEQPCEEEDLSSNPESNPNPKASNKQGLVSPEDAFALPSSPFSIDRSLWLINFQDGSTRIFDSQIAQFVE